MLTEWVDLLDVMVGCVAVAAMAWSCHATLQLRLMSLACDIGSEGVIVVDRDSCRIVYLNHELCERTGWQVGETFGSYVVDGQPAAGPACGIAAGSRSGEQEMNESMLLTATGQVEIVVWAASDVHLLWRKFAVGVFPAEGMIRKLLSNAVSSRESATRAEQQAHQLVRYIRHELRTLLRTGPAMLQLLEAQLKTSKILLSGRQQEMLTLAVDSGKDALQLLDDMKSIEELDSVDCAPVEVCKIFDKARVRFVDKNVSWICPQGVKVLADLDKIAFSVLCNLVDNACKYSPEKSPVEVRARTVGRFCIFLVIDRGPGITEENRDRIRKFGTRSRLSADEEGFGLGLFICSLALQAHQAKLEVASNLKCPGSTFYFALPLEGSEP